MPSHSALGQTYEEMGRPADAEWEFSKFLETLSEADERLPQLVDARERLATLTWTRIVEFGHRKVDVDALNE